MTEKQIQEIMALVDEYAKALTQAATLRMAGYDVEEEIEESRVARAAIEFALREQVPQPEQRLCKVGGPCVPTPTSSCACRELPHQPPVTQAEQPKAQREPMTDEQINEAYGAARVQHDHIPHDDVKRIVRAVERFHGITKDGK